MCLHKIHQITVRTGVKKKLGEIESNYILPIHQVEIWLL